MCIFLDQKKYGIWRDFSEKFQVLCKNPDEVTRFDGNCQFKRIRKRKISINNNTAGGPADLEASGAVSGWSWLSSRER